MTTSRHTDLSLAYVLSTPSSRSDTTEMPLVVVLHGRGADANDLADLAPEVDAPSGYRFVFPDAPRAFEPYPGMSMSFGRSWFDGWPAEHGSVVESRTKLLTFLDELLARYPTPAGKIVLSGFSQGGLMSVDVGFRTATPLAGLVVMSGAGYEEELPDFSARKNQRVLIVHGEQDEVVPVIEARRLRALLETAGVEPEYHEFGMGHQVSPASLAVVEAFLQRCLD
jgi:phospholipase/carboxylesterase